MDRNNLAEVIEIDTAASFARGLERAGELLRRGEIVGVPTETVYGLAGNALNPEAVSKIFAAKGRPATNPLIVHVGSLAMANRCVAAWPASAEILSRAFWPGPLTLVLSRNKIIPDAVTGGGNTVAIRWPSHPFMSALVSACDFPLAAPSANLSGAVSSTNAQHVLKHLGHKISLIVDAGQSQLGIESTVIDLTGDLPTILRPGVITPAMLSGVLGREARISNEPAEDSALHRSPGLLSKHYAPRAKLLLWAWDNENQLMAELKKHGYPPEKCHVISHTRVPLRVQYGLVSVIPYDPEAFGRAIYAELHRGDESAIEFIVLEALPDSPEWAAIQDRLRRASA